MSRFFKILLITACLISGIFIVGESFGQSLTAGVAFMENKLTFTGSFRSTIDRKEKLSISAVTRFDKPYRHDENRNMIIGNLGYAIAPSFSTLIGTLYSPPKTLTPLVAFQYLWSKPNFYILLFPNLVLGKVPSALSFIMAEYTKEINPELNGFLRLQNFVVNGFHDHYFSSCRLRAGLSRGKLEGGFALDNDFSGNEFSYRFHGGIFMQYQIFE